MSIKSGTENREENKGKTCPIDCFKILEEAKEKGFGILIGREFLEKDIPDLEEVAPTCDCFPDEIIVIEEKCECLEETLGDRGLFVYQDGGFRKVL